MIRNEGLKSKRSLQIEMDEAVDLPMLQTLYAFHDDWSQNDCLSCSSAAIDRIPHAETLSRTLEIIPKG